MKNRQRLLLLSVLIALASVCTLTGWGGVAASQVGNAHRPLVIAHRGASGTAPENTMAAFRRAVELGVDMIELDVHLTKDGSLVVIHDDTVDRTTEGQFTGKVSDLTLEEIRSLDAGAWKGPEFAGERIPTLEEVLSEFKGKTKFLIELKGAGVEAKTVQTIRETGTEDSVYIQSFDTEAVKRAHDILPKVPAGVLFSAPNAYQKAVFDIAVVIRTHEATRNAKGSFVGIRYDAVTPSLAKYVKGKGLGLFVWTVNDAQVMEEMTDLGVDGIITNYPETLIEVLK